MSQSDSEGAQHDSVNLSDEESAESGEPTPFSEQLPESAEQPPDQPPDPIAEESAEQPAKRSRTKRIFFWLAVCVGSLLILAVGGNLAAYGIDTRVHNGQVLRNVTLSFDDGTTPDIAIGGLSEDDLRQLLEDLAAQHGQRTVEWSLPTDPSRTVTTTMSELNLGIDVDATVANAMAAGRSGNLGSRVEQWLDAFSDPHRVSVSYFAETNPNSPALADVEDIIVSEPTDPKIEFADTSGAIIFTPGQDGSIICASDIVSQVIAAADPKAQKINVGEIPATTVPTRFSNQALTASISELNRKTARGLTVTSKTPPSVSQPSVSRQFTSAEIRRWLEIDLELRPTRLPELSCANLSEYNSNQSAEIKIALADPQAVHAAFEERYSDDIVPGNFGVITVLNDTPVAPFPEPGYRCCDEFDTDGVLHTIFSDQDDASLEVPFRQDPELLPDFAQDGEIKVKVGEFTTMHQPNEPRVTNIQRFADLVRGAIIEPGELFSLNDHVGERTEEKGFVEAGVIYRGIFQTDVGGGVSQFATTFFNAAFFAGLDFREYMSHSLYISRYPYGREATISWPYVDLVVENTTPYPILIWTSYTDTSITVTMYSTKSLEAEQTDQIEVEEGVCIRVYTERTRTYLDGRQAPPDRVTALYRPEEGITCTGEPFVPAPDCDDNEIGVDTDDDGWPDSCSVCPTGQIADRSEPRNDVCVPAPAQGRTEEAPAQTQ